MIFFFLFLLHVAYDHQVRGGGPNGSPSVEAYCPFGGIESLYQFITTGGLVRRIEPSAMILMAAVLLLTLIFSRGFCGWICPFGSVQEWLGLLGRKIFKRTYNPAGPWEKRLRYLKYLILGIIVAFSWHLGTLVFRPYDPFLAFFHLGQGFREMPYAYAALGVVLLDSLKHERFFCKYACPLGAVIGIVGKVGLTKIVRACNGARSLPV
jgi:polyferredoxin